jgi:hypothetical protein
VCTPQTRAYGLKCDSHEVVQFARRNTRGGWMICNVLAQTKTWWKWFAQELCERAKKLKQFAPGA